MQKLTKFAKIGRVTGPGFIMVDGFLRTNWVYQSWKNGENWERKAVVEGGSFLAGIGADYAFKDIIGWLYDLVD